MQKLLAYQLVCDDNQLTSLNVSGATALTSLRCYNNQLTSLDVSNNNALGWLNCSENELNCIKGVPADCFLQGSTRCE